MRAHVAGALDLSRADIFDPRWWTRAQFVINEFETAAVRKLDEYEYQLTLALANGDADEETLRLYLEEAEMLNGKFAETLTPWEATQATDLHDVIRDMHKQYVEVFGDPEDPEYQKEIERTIAYLTRAK